ncbi:hypothetical protein YB2330_004223 [Saitoella coloradoensis]
MAGHEMELDDRIGPVDLMDQSAFQDSKDAAKAGSTTASITEVTLDREGRPPLLRSLTHEILFLITCATATALSSLSVGSANTALTSIGNDLHMYDASSLSWIVSAFSLASGCVLLSAGRAADLYGRRKVFLVGGVIFTAACIICGFSKNKEMMYTLRAMQGLGAGICTPAGVGMIGAMYLPDTRRKEKAFGLLGAASALAFLTGVLLGGICSQLLSWRWIYWIMSIIAALMVAGGVFVVPKECDVRNPGNLDWIGLGLSVVGVSLLTYSVTASTDAPHGWRTWYIPTLLVIAILVIALFIASQHWQADPMMPLSVWAFPNFALMMAIVFLAWGVFEVITVYIVLYFQNIKEATPLLTSAYFVPDVIFGSLSIPLSALLLRWLQKRWVLCIGLIFLLIPTILYGLVTEHTSYWAIPFPAISISAVGGFFLYTIANLFCSSSAPPEQQSLVGGVFNTMLQITTAVTLALAATAANSTGADETGKEEKARGYHTANWMCCGMIGLAIVLCVLLTEKPKGEIAEEGRTDIDNCKERSVGDLEVGQDPGLHRTDGTQAHSA